MKRQGNMVAISYAAHMIYKLYEQQTLQESMEGK